MKPSRTAERTPLLACMRGISKRFGEMDVLRNVQLEIRHGEVHVLAGENGAGKSTLIKILAGVHLDFEGQIEIDGRIVRPRTPQEARALGIAVIHQEFSLIGPMSVADNIFLGRTPTRAGLVQSRRQQAWAEDWMRQLELDIDVRLPVEHFSIATQQLIEIAKALSQDARVIIMDEPTSTLNAPDVEKLFSLIQTLKQRGCGIVYISHKMEEIERVADRITVLRDGEWIGTAEASELPHAKLIEWMVGRDFGAQFLRRAPKFGGARLRLENFSVFPKGFSKKPAIRNLSLTVHSGEILGVGGLQGSGASEFLHGLFGGYDRYTRGTIYLDDKPVRFSRPAQAIRSGMALLTNDRKNTGLILSLSVTANATLAGLSSLSPGGWRRPERERKAAQAATAPMRLRAASLDLEVSALSGGNQQKVAIAKWLQTKPSLLLMDEPTRGVDIAAKQEIYQLMDALTAQGIAIILITSEMPELLMLSDRVIVLHRGNLTAEFTRAQATPTAVLAAAMGNSFIAHARPSSNDDAPSIFSQPAAASSG